MIQLYKKLGELMNENYNYQNGSEPDYYEIYTKNSIKEATKTFSRFSLSLFVYLVVVYAVIFAAEVIMLLALGKENFTELLTTNAIFTHLFNSIPQYLIAFPILYLMVKGMKTKYRQKTNMCASEFFSLFLISQTAMFAGNLIGEAFNGFFSVFKGSEVTDPVGELIASSPIWLLFITVVIIGPIFEELIFRKLMIDRLSRYGELVAVMASSIAFGLFHGNFYQFFYAVMLGLILGYMYAKTRNIKYSIIMHMLINFFGSILSIPIAESAEKLFPQLENIQNGIEVNMADFLKNAMLVGSYSIIQYAMIIAGVVLFVKSLKRGKFRIKSTYEYKIPSERVASIAIFNPGTILFLVLTVLIFVSNIVM